VVLGRAAVGGAPDS